MNDFEKNKDYISDDTDTQILIIATNFKNKLKNEHTKFLKYISGINSTLSDYMALDIESYDDTYRKELILTCQNRMNKYFDQDKFKMDHHYIKAGEAFGIGVELHFWILEKKLCACENKDGWLCADNLAPNNDDTFSSNFCPYCKGYKTR